MDTFGRLIAVRDRAKARNREVAAFRVSPDVLDALREQATLRRTRPTPEQAHQPRFCGIPVETDPALPPDTVRVEVAEPD